MGTDHAITEMLNLAAYLGVLGALLGQICYVAWRFGRIEQRLEDFAQGQRQMWELLRRHLHL